MGRWIIAILFACAGAYGAESCPGNVVAAGEFTAPDGSHLSVPAFCRVAGDGFEVWLPSSGWSGRYYQLGTGGFAGSIPYTAMAAELRDGNAVAATDTGHRGAAVDASWALNAPDRIADYGYRSVESTARIAGDLVTRVYGKPANHRYFAGCSNGGRQALMAAQRSPQLWDGILAGAPAYNWTRQLSAFAWIQQRLRSRPENFIGVEKLPAIQQAALAACTEDPLRCKLDPATLGCQGAETNSCLTRPQVESLRVILQGPPGYFGYEPTAAAVPDNWEHWIVDRHPAGDSQLNLAEQFFRFVVFSDPGWSLARWRGEADVQLAEKYAGQLDATDTNLRPFQQHGGKLLMYFGWADAVISPRAAIDYYEKVPHAAAFMRLYMVPGMTHCQGGPAPDSFGQSSVSPPLQDDARHSIRRALEQWVEKSVAPGTLVAAKFAGDQVVATQQLCPFRPRTYGSLSSCRAGAHAGSKAKTKGDQR